MRSVVLFSLLAIAGPVLAQWQTLANAPVGLTFPVVVELQGEIHVIGGGGPGGATTLHLRYTPATDVWDTLAPVPYAAQQPCGAVLDGRIHFCGGGFPNSGSPLDDHYAYDPVLDTWDPAADLPFPTVINEAAVLNGKLYVLSGQPDRQLCQSYDPGANAWTAHNDLPDMDFWYGAIVSTNSTIYRFGGGGYIAPTNIAMVYDQPNDAWNYLPDLNNFLHAPAGAALGDTLICIGGGYWNTETDAVWMYHTASQAYTAAAALPSPRAYHSLVTIGNCVYSVGGNGADPNLDVSLVRNCTLAGPVGIGSSGGGMDPCIFTARGNDLLIGLAPTAAGSTAAIRVFDGMGKLVLQRDERSITSVVLNGTERAAGVYAITVELEGRSYQGAWIVTR